MKILLAEDEEQLSRVYKAALEHQGYEVDQAFNGQEALDLALESVYHVIILDIMMPVKTGLEALKEIRESGNKSHIIMLTAMAEINDRVTGLDSGADEYLTKPISLKELLARLRSMERRLDTFTPKILTAGTVSLNIAEQELTAGNSIRLSSKESQLMEFLMLNTDKSLSIKEIFQQVWGRDDDEEVTQDYVYVYISYLRQKLKAIKADLEITGEEAGPFKLAAIGGDSHV
ncbi:response regulator transcription factor [Streptococcus dentapri]|uniref:Response regulator transcription factor n=1 Tax=Streptococcus dentapri TaxID=573564 RepID=A0ABV8D390_9STRE